MGVRARYLSPYTYKILNELKLEDESVDEFVTKMLEHYIGIDCKHLNTELYMRIPLTPEKFMDVNATVKLLDDIRCGKESDKLLNVCLDCKRAKIYRM